MLPELNVGFDFGRAPRELLSIDHVFLSHGHTDHAAGVAYYFSQRMFVDNAPGHAYVPGPLVAPLENLLTLWGDIDGQIPPGHIHAVEPGTDVTVRRDLIVRPFEVCHACRSRRSRFQALGFSVIEVRRKLKDEYQGLHGPQIVELKNQGIDVTRRVELPLVTYCGDTGPGDFLSLDHVRKSKVLLLECTFVDPEHRERARAGNHIHVADLPDIYPKLDNERIVLTHLTRRTNLRDAKTALVEHLGEEALERVSFLGEHRRPRRRRPTAEQEPGDVDAP
ncbi:MAG: MBL fold metallo-hydrolase [Phycisphaerae bacterium]|nr:MBL fold metallo-hydrolase [Phycisphaerae bacterium]